MISLQELGDLLYLKNHLYDTYFDHYDFDNPRGLSHEPLDVAMKLDEVRVELQKRAEEYEADGRYRDAEYLYRRIIESSDLDVSVRIQKILVSLYEKLGDFPAAERMQEDIVSKIALSRCSNDDTPLNDGETLIEVRHLIQIYTMFKLRIAMLDPAGGAEMCILHRAASIDVKCLNSFLMDPGLAADSPDLIRINAMNAESNRRLKSYQTIPPIRCCLKYNNWPTNREPPRPPVDHDSLLENDPSSPETIGDTSDEDNERPIWGFNAFHIAAKNGAINLAELLLDNGANIESLSQDYYWTGLHFATKSAHIEMMRWLIKNGANIDAKDCIGRTALHLASSIGSSAAVRLLLENGAQTEIVAYDEMTPLRFAWQKDHYDVIVLLLESGAHVDAKALCLHRAATLGLSKIMRSLLRLPAERVGSIDSTGYTMMLTPLHCAAANGHKSLVRILLDEGANFEAKDITGRTPLHVASQNGHPAAMRLLLGQGADIEATQHDESTALHLAVSNGHERAVKLLLENGVNTEARNFHWSTALHIAAAIDLDTIAGMLIEHGADLETRDRYQNTALHKAASFGSERMMALLLEKGAEMNAQSPNGSAVYHAIINNHEGAVRSLLQHGATCDLAEIPGWAVADKGFWECLLDTMGQVQQSSTAIA